MEVVSSISWLLRSMGVTSSAFVLMYCTYTGYDSLYNCAPVLEMFATTVAVHAAPDPCPATVRMLSPVYTS